VAAVGGVQSLHAALLARHTGRATLAALSLLAFATSALQEQPCTDGALVVVVVRSGGGGGVESGSDGSRDGLVVVMVVLLVVVVEGGGGSDGVGVCRL
jgi:hypothetical protein